MDNITCKIYNNQQYLNLFFFKQNNKKNKLFLKFNIKSNYIYKNSNVYNLNSQNLLKKYIYFFNKYIQKSLRLIIQLHYNYYYKLNVIGLGYKNFVLNNNLYILIGDCNYIIIPIPNDIKLYCKKKQIYLLGLNKDTLNYFASNLKLLKKINYYKGKGILEFKNFKFMKLKTGKKQRFM